MQEWLNKLKIAIAEEDIESIGKLFAVGFGGGVNGADGVSTDELVQAANLASEALKLVEREKNALAGTINKIKTAKKFFK